MAIIKTFRLVYCDGLFPPLRTIWPCGGLSLKLWSASTSSSVWGSVLPTSPVFTGTTMIYYHCIQWVVSTGSGHIIDCMDYFHCFQEILHCEDHFVECQLLSRWTEGWRDGWWREWWRWRWGRLMSTHNSSSRPAPDHGYHRWSDTLHSVHHQVLIITKYLISQSWQVTKASWSLIMIGHHITSNREILQTAFLSIQAEIWWINGERGEDPDGSNVMPGSLQSSGNWELVQNHWSMLSPWSAGHLITKSSLYEISIFSP